MNFIMPIELAGLGRRRRRTSCAAVDHGLPVDGMRIDGLGIIAVVGQDLIFAIGQIADALGRRRAVPIRFFTSSGGTFQ